MHWCVSTSAARWSPMASLPGSHGGAWAKRSTSPSMSRSESCSIATSRTALPVRLRSSAPVARVPTRGEPAVSPNPRAVVLLSGGLDSATALAIAKTQGFDAYALSFRYGQRHAYELEAARRVAAAVGARDHVMATIDLRVFGGGG